MEEAEPSNGEVVARLDRTIALPNLRNVEALENVRERIRTSPVYLAHLVLVQDWKETGTMQGEGCAGAGQKECNVRNRITEPNDLGLLERRGAGFNTTYRSKGLL